MWLNLICLDDPRLTLFAAYIYIYIYIYISPPDNKPLPLMNDLRWGVRL